VRGGARGGGHTLTLDLDVLLIGPAVGSDDRGVAVRAERRGRRVHDGHGDGGPGQPDGVPARAVHRRRGPLNGVVIRRLADELRGRRRWTRCTTTRPAFGVRQVDATCNPVPRCVTAGVGTTLDATTAQLTAAGLAALPELKGPGADGRRHLRHPASAVAARRSRRGCGTPRATCSPACTASRRRPAGERSELALTFDYNASQTQWLLWRGAYQLVTQDLHLAVPELLSARTSTTCHRRQRVELAAAVHAPPPRAVDVGCPASAQAIRRRPPDSLMSAADVAYVATGRNNRSRWSRLQRPSGAAPRRVPRASSAQLRRSTHGERTTYTDPGVTVTHAPDNSGLSTRCWQPVESTGSRTRGRTSSWAAWCGSRCRSTRGRGHRRHAGRG